jgi:hypothetical protein
MSLRRVPAHTIAGGFSTLIAMLPWKFAEAEGLSEDASAGIAAVFLATLALSAWLLRKRAWVRQRNYALAPFHDEVFSLEFFLRDFAAFALVLLILYGGIWIALAYHGL